MSKDTKILSLLIVAAIVYFGLKFYSRKSPEQRIEEMLFEARKSFGNNIVLSHQNYIGYKLDTLISKEKYSEALTVLDTANISNDLKFDYKGQILLKQGKAQESIDMFNQSLALSGRFSKAMSHRAEAYLKLKIYDSAIIDYKNISDFNYDFYRPLAETYELMNKKDSAIKYYQLFLDNYPDSVSVKNKIRILENAN